MAKSITIRAATLSTLIFGIAGPPTGFTLLVTFMSKTPLQTLAAICANFVLLGVPIIALAIYGVGLLPALAAGLISAWIRRFEWPRYLLASCLVGVFCVWVPCIFFPGPPMSPKLAFQAWPYFGMGAGAGGVCAALNLVLNNVDRPYPRVEAIRRPLTLEG